VRTLIDSGAVISEMRDIDGKMVHYWRATGEGADFDIPDNLQSLLAARVDRLEEPTRATLQIASVIGRSFYRKVLQAVDEASLELDKHLGTLLRLDMIREAARMPELEYAFRNPMTQEAVYNTILLKRRRGVSPPGGGGHGSHLLRPAGRALRPAGASLCPGKPD